MKILFVFTNNSFFLFAGKYYVITRIHFVSGNNLTGESVFRNIAFLSIHNNREIAPKRNMNMGFMYRRNSGGHYKMSFQLFNSFSPFFSRVNLQEYKYSNNSIIEENTQARLEIDK